MAYALYSLVASLGLFSSHGLKVHSAECEAAAVNNTLIVAKAASNAQASVQVVTAHGNEAVAKYLAQHSVDASSKTQDPYTYFRYELKLPKPLLKTDGKPAKCTCHFDKNGWGEHNMLGFMQDTSWSNSITCKPEQPVLYGAEYVAADGSSDSSGAKSPGVLFWCCEVVERRGSEEASSEEAESEEVVEEE
eukprot:TRINITY_DN76692_c0_g1_i1.p1 TRINITY_DN76692_c0_g1~~TRINITY_DN76692_c0_g1_i1.p1  ORF type:complete len:191 (-),score=34.53 TRINITY_DN76692_c0_g1_i1:143-715(-)